MYELRVVTVLLLFCYSFSSFGMMQTEKFSSIQEIKDKVLSEPLADIKASAFFKGLGDSDQFQKGKYIKIASVLYMNGGFGVNKGNFLQRLNNATKRDGKINDHKNRPRPFNHHYFLEKSELNNFFSVFNTFCFPDDMNIHQIKQYPVLEIINSSLLDNESKQSFKSDKIKKINFLKLIPTNAIDLNDEGKSKYVIINYAKSYLNVLKRTYNNNFKSFSGFKNFDDFEVYCNKKMEIFEQALIIESVDSVNWGMYRSSKKEVIDTINSFYKEEELKIIKNFGSVEAFESFLNSDKAYKKYIEQGFVDKYEKYVKIITEGHTDYGPYNSYMYAFVKATSHKSYESNREEENTINYLLNNFDPQNMAAKTKSSEIKKDINVHLFMKEFLSVKKNDDYYEGLFFTNKTDEFIQCKVASNCNMCNICVGGYHSVRPAFLFHKVINTIMGEKDRDSLAFIQLVNRFYQDQMSLYNSDSLINSLCDAFDTAVKHNRPGSIELQTGGVSVLEGEEIN